MNNIIPIVITFLLLAGCKKKNSASDVLKFASTPTQATIAPGEIDDVSGIADSKLNAGYLWAEEDGGNSPEIHLLKHDGSLLKKIFIKNAINRDWEDIAIGSGPDNNLSYLYLADVGDNNQHQNNYFIYRFPEPLATTDTVFAVDKISFSYPDGSHDAEAILVNSVTKDIYIITKRDAFSKVFRLAYPQSTVSLNSTQLVATLSFTNTVSAAISNNGNEIIIKTYTGLFFWQRLKGKNIEEVLKEKPVELRYLQEPQGEAICFKNDGSGFFTLSEKSFAPFVTLNFYKRL